MAIIKYLGHSAFEIVLTGLDGSEKYVLVDPWIENPLSPVKLSDYSGRKIDYIFVTHDHGDHLGNAIELARSTGAKIVGVFELASYAKEQGIEAIDGNIGGRLNVDDLFIVFTPATHSSQRGVPVGVVFGGKDVTIYHAGDTGLFSEMGFIGELYNPDIALLPIGGHYTMGIREAVKAVQLIRPRIAIPMHYNTFPPIKADPKEFKKLVESTTNTKVVILKPGETYTYP
ncbi:MAG: metal-dependent hydrolase [Desulfurococcales archaeon ex4484_58]|nr:MAG: metal-dependent hydrolase [Desulfurococcales archaeon ex4484_58]